MIKEIPFNLKVKKTHDVIDGDQIILQYENGKVFGGTTQNTKQEVFYTKSIKERNLIESFGKNNFINILNDNGFNIKSIL